MQGNLPPSGGVNGPMQPCSSHDDVSSAGSMSMYPAVIVRKEHAKRVFFSVFVSKNPERLFFCTSFIQPLPSLCNDVIRPGKPCTTLPHHAPFLLPLFLPVSVLPSLPLSSFLLVARRGAREEVKFTIFNHRHNCRKCQEPVCHQCSRARKVSIVRSIHQQIVNLKSFRWAVGGRGVNFCERRNEYVWCWLVFVAVGVLVLQQLLLLANIHSYAHNS